mgnify:CR=1 FL=1
MPFYQRLGEVPRKRHVQFRDNGTLLTEEVLAPAQRTLRVMRGGKLLFETPVDEDAVLVWSSDRNLLFIPE